MSKFVRSQLCTFSFDGDKVTARLSPLEYGDMMRLQSNSGSRDRITEFVGVAQDIAPKYIADFSGLRDSDGNAVDFDTVAKQVYFAELLRDVVGKLMEISQPRAESADPT